MHNFYYMDHWMFLMKNTNLQKNCINQLLIRFLKEIEVKQEYKIFGFVTPSNIRFLILTD